MKKRGILALMLIGLFLTGCKQAEPSIVQQGIDFTLLPGSDFPDLEGDTDISGLQVRIIREDSNRAYFAVGLPYNAQIENINLLKDNRALINLMLKPELERSDPFLSLSPVYYQVVSVDKKYKKCFEKEKVAFSLGTEILKPLIEYTSALKHARDHMEADFLSTMDCLALMKVDGVLRLAYIFFFGDGENINRAGDELVQGAAAVDSQNGQLLEYRIFKRKQLPGVHRHGDAINIKGWKDANTLVVSAVDGGEFYLMDMGKTKKNISKDQAEDYIGQYIRTMAPPTGWEFVIRTETNDLGFVYTADAYLEYSGPRGRIDIEVDPNVNVVTHGWDKSNKALYFTTEMAEPSYGNDWTYYTLWRFDIENRALIKMGGIPSEEVFLSPDGLKAAYNGPDGGLFIMNTGKLLNKEPILK